MNSLIAELYHIPNKSKRLQEDIDDLGNMFELMFFLGQSEADGFLHDETKGGMHHPKHEKLTYY